MTPDPAGQAAADLGNPQSNNRYAYALDNPASVTDRSGLCPGCFTDGDGGGGGWAAMAEDMFGISLPGPRGGDCFIDDCDFLPPGVSIWGGTIRITQPPTSASSFLPGDEVYVPSSLDPFQKMIGCVTGVLGGSPGSCLPNDSQCEFGACGSSSSGVPANGFANDKLAPPLDKSACGTYDSAGRTDLGKICRGAGDSWWSQRVRGCLLSFFDLQSGQYHDEACSAGYCPWQSSKGLRILGNEARTIYSRSVLHCRIVSSMKRIISAILTSLLFVLLGALSFWVPEIALFTFRIGVDGLVLTPVLLAAFCLMYVSVCFWTRQQVGISPWLCMLIGVWIFGPAAMTLAQNALESGLRASVSGVDLHQVIAYSIRPYYTFVMSTYNGSLGALFLITVGFPWIHKRFEKKRWIVPPVLATRVARFATRVGQGNA